MAMLFDDARSQLLSRLDTKDPSLVLYAPLWRPDMVAVGGYIEAGTGTMAVSPLVLNVGANTITATGAGTFTIYSSVGGTCASGTATITGSPVTMTAGIPTTVTTGVTTGNFTVTTSNIIRSQDKNRHSCTITGATWGSQGRVLDGNDLIEVTNNAMFGFTNNFTIHVWFKAVAPADYPYIIARGVFGATKHGWGIRVEAGQTQLQFHVCDGTNLYATASISFTSDTWTHVVCTFSRPTGLVYINGVVSASTLTADAVIDNYDDEITMFKNIERGTFLTGSLGEFGLLSRALTAGEVARLYQITKWRYK